MTFPPAIDHHGQCEKSLGRLIMVCQAAGMTSRISHIAVDAHDAYAQSVWWGQVLGRHEDPDDPSEPGDEECVILDPDGALPVLFIEVPEGKERKNRLNFDLRPVDGTRDEEVDRLVGLGAQLIADLRRPDGTGWVTLADPEGNEFDVLRSDAELAASPRPSS
jgi:hypothetical protein